MAIDRQILRPKVRRVNNGKLLHTPDAAVRSAYLNTLPSAVAPPEDLTTRPTADGRARGAVLAGSIDGIDILAAQAGDDTAFVRLVRRYEHALAGQLLRFSRNEAVLQDLRQETYLEAYRSLSNYRHHGTFSSWLRQIAARVGYRYWAGQAREAQARIAYLEMRGRQGCGALKPLEWDDLDRAMGLLACLSSNDRILVEMKYFQGLRATEIAQRLGWKVTRVRVRLHRALKGLKRLQDESSHSSASH